MSYETPAGHLTAADTSRDASGAGAVRIYLATQDCYLEKATFQALGTNAATAARIFISSLDEQAGTCLNREVTLAETTASEVAGLAHTELAIEQPLRAGQRVLATVGTAPSAGWDVSLAILGGRLSINREI